MSKVSVWLSALLFSVTVSLPFQPELAYSAGLYFFQGKITSDATGHVQVYYDLGHGFNEADSTRISLNASPTPTEIKLELPPGNYSALRLDPIDAAARISLSDLKIVTSRGKILAEFASSDLTPANQIIDVTTEGKWTHLTTAGSDPYLFLRLAQPLSPHLNLGDHARSLAAHAVPVFVGLLLLVAIWNRLQTAATFSLADRMSRLSTWAQNSPRKAIAFCAIGGVIASAYPVVFLGRSYVSPNFKAGTYLLYENFPTLPGYRDTDTVDAAGSDVGAMLWQDVPTSIVQSRALLHDGQLPLWNRFNSAGAVLLGQGQSMFGDPLHLIPILAGGNAWAWDIKFLAAKWLLACGIGFIVWKTACDLPSSVVATLASTFVGFFLYRVNHPAFFSFCYGPWILYAWLGMSEEMNGRRRAGWAIALIAANWCEMNSGTAKEAYVLLFSLNLTGVLVLFFSGQTVRNKFAGVFFAGLSGAVLLLLSAPIWWTFVDSLRESYTSYTRPTAFQIQPSLILGLFDEVFYRPIQRYERVFNPSANFLVLFGVLYFLATLRRVPYGHFAHAIAVGAFISLAFAFGLVPSQWITRIPFFANIAHIDNTFSCALILQLLILSGFGFRSAFRRLPGSEGKSDLLIVALLFTAMAFGWIAFLQTVHRPAFGDPETLTLFHWGENAHIGSFVWCSLVLLPSALAALIYFVRQRLLWGHWTFSTGILALLCCLVLLWRFGAQANIGFDHYLFRPGPREHFFASSDAIEMVKSDQANTPWRTVGLDGNLFPGWSAAYNLEGIVGPDALMNPSYRELTEALGLERIWDWRIVFHADKLREIRPAADMLNIKYYLDYHGDTDANAKNLSFMRAADLDVYRSNSAWPRAFFTDKIFPYHNATELAAKVRGSDGRPFAAMLQDDAVQQPELVGLGADLDKRRIAPADDYKLSNNSSSFHVSAPGPGVVVLNEAWLADDFSVSTNGHAAKVLRLNHAFKGVYLDRAGDYDIKFSYWPKHFSVALLLASLGVLAFAGLCYAARTAKHSPDARSV